MQRGIRRTALLALALLATAAASSRAQAPGGGSRTMASRRQIETAVIRAVLREPYRDTLAVTCLSLGPSRAAPDSAFLAAVQVPGHGAVVAPGRCPPTYEIGERVGPNPPPRPPGARDPHLTWVAGVTPLRGGRARVQVWEDQGAHRTGYTCTATRAASGWSAGCRVTYVAVV